MSDAAPTDRGWWHPANSRKAHYVIAGRSLCGRWGALGSVILFGTESNVRDCCAACRRKLAAILALVPEEAHET